MNDTLIACLCIIFIMMFLVLLSYVYCLYKVTKIPAHLLDVDALWAGLYDPINRNKPKYCAWLLFGVGEVLSCAGIVTHVVLLCMEPDKASVAFCILYFLFFIAILFWPILAMYGGKYYFQTMFGLFMVAVSAGGLFVASVYAWGVHDRKSWVLFPLFLHTTFTDFLFWGFTWNPKNIPSFSEIQTDASIKPLDPVFTIEEV